jgi:hypothetical protein
LKGNYKVLGGEFVASARHFVNYNLEVMWQEVMVDQSKTLMQYFYK